MATAVQGHLLKLGLGVLMLVVGQHAAVVSGQRGVVFVHGLLGNTSEFEALTHWIQKDFPTVHTTALDAFNNLDSLTSMWRQVPEFQAQFVKAMTDSPDGIVLICYSQGGLICHALLSLLDHNVQTMISLSSPLAGEYGDLPWMKQFPDHIIKRFAYKWLYTVEGQQLSFGNYWNDPHHHELYLKEVDFLPILNNESYNPNSTEYKKNFLQLKNLVLVGGPQDSVIGPWQSSLFEFFDENEVVQPMENQTWYKTDAFGLRTMSEEGRIHTHIFPNVHHTRWPYVFDVYQKCIRPWLSRLELN